MSIITSLKKVWRFSTEVWRYATFSRIPFYEIANKYLQHCGKILDIGAGSGEFIKFIERGDIFAIDSNPNTVNKLRHQGINADYAILPEIPYPDNYFDGIHISHVLEHLYPEDFYSTLKQIDRVLKQGGVLVISSPLLWNGFYADLSHIKPYDPAIYLNYLVGSNPQMRTRSIIGGYELVNLIYRYNLEEIKPIMWRGCRFLNFLSILMAKGLKKIGIGYLHKTGYTIVLKKAKRS